MENRLLHRTSNRYLLLLPIMALFLAVAGWGSNAYGQATVKTDRDDYYPGETVVITGTGWDAGETVNLVIKHLTYVHPDDLFSAVADASGNISTSEYYIEDWDLGESFELDAKGVTSGREAVAYFTDASWTISASPTIICGGVATEVSFTITQTSNNKKNQSYGLNFPSGWVVGNPTAITISGKTWSGTTSGNSICLHASDATNEMSNNDVLTFKALVTPSSTIGAFAMPTSYANTSLTCNYTSGTSFSSGFTFAINSYAPIITTPPTDQIATYGDPSASFAVLADGTGTMTYQWQVSSNGGSTWINTGTNSNSLTVASPTVAMNNYQYHCIVTNICGSTTSSVGILIVNPKPITITADSKAKTYGDSDPAFTYQITSGTIVNGDLPSGSLSRVAGENVGNYAINKNTLSYGANYAITYTGANLVINPLAVTVTADAKSKYCGQVDPTLTFISNPVIGTILPNGISVSFTGTIKRIPGEGVGDYWILQNDLNNSNYAITYQSALFHILSITIDASASSTPVALGGIPTLKATVTPGVAGIPVEFKVENSSNQFSSYYSTTNSVGFASAIGSGLTSVDVYKVTAIAGDGCAESTAYLAVYDPNGGFVTGGGWINSPAGSYVASPLLTGKANFGFVAKYKKGSTKPDGNTEFQFKAGNLNFSSDNYDIGSLVISGAKATYRGVGTINGAGSYNFVVIAYDGDVKGADGIDKFRIKITNGGTVVYDNNLGKDENDVPTTALGGGSIVIHKDGKSGELGDLNLPGSQSDISTSLQVYPNPTPGPVTMKFILKEDSKVSLDILNSTGQVIRRAWDGYAKGGEFQTVNLDENLAAGLYFIQLRTANEIKTARIVVSDVYRRPERP